MAESPPRILVTNDDGVNAHGIRTLEQIARTMSEDVWVVAPESNNSGAGHSLTLTRPLRVRRAGPRHFAVDGTPTDCVLLGLQRLVEGRAVDLVLSGINHGGNLADDVTYSGTIAAAMEATLLGVRAIAFSQVCKSRQRIKWTPAETFAPDLIGRLAGMDWPRDMLVNVNFPDKAARAVRGVKVTRQGKRKLGDEIVQRRDPRGEPYFWIGAARNEAAVTDGTDLAAIEAGYVSVTPIHLDMTHRASFVPLADALGQKADAGPA